jgi:hypothetical protein
MTGETWFELLFWGDRQKGKYIKDDYNKLIDPLTLVSFLFELKLRRRRRRRRRFFTGFSHLN